MNEDSTNNLENRVTTETLFTDITEEKIKKSKEYIQIEESYVEGDRIYISVKTGKRVVYIDGIQPIMLEQGIGLVKGYLDIMQDSYGFLRDKTLRNTKNDVYVSQTMIKMFGLSIGDSVLGVTREAEEMKKQYQKHLDQRNLNH